MTNLYVKDKLKLLDKVNSIDCSNNDCVTCSSRNECYKLRQIMKYN